MGSGKRDGGHGPLDPQQEGIVTVIWAVGHAFNFGLVKPSVLDEFGYPIASLIAADG